MEVKPKFMAQISKYRSCPRLVWLSVGVLSFIYFLIAFYRHGGNLGSPLLRTKTSTNGIPVEKTIIRDGPHDEYLAVCLTVRDQAGDMVEFFEHHYYNIGIRRFYVMDHGSDPPLSSFQDQYGIPIEAMDFIYHEKSAVDNHQVAQLEIYDECAQVWGVNNTWIAFFDADEFLDTTDEKVDDMLQNLHQTRPDAGALAINWIVHTSNHQLHRAKSARQTYLECIDDGPEKMGTSNSEIKSIVRSDAYLSTNGNPHKFNLKEGFVTVGEHGDTVELRQQRQPATRDRIALHHYQVKSWEDYNDKMSRSNKNWDFWDLIEYKTPHTSCVQMLKYFPKAPNRPGFLD